MLRNSLQREDSSKNYGSISIFSIDYHTDICLFICFVNWRIKVHRHAHT
jgi:hypothetical protein